MAEQLTKRIPEAGDRNGADAVESRLRTLLELALAIGAREGLLGTHGVYEIEASHGRELDV